MATLAVHSAAEAAPAARSPRNRIRGFDGIRGIAATAVVFCHTVAGKTQIGGYAVNIFFVLSGFLLLNALYSSRVAIETGRGTHANELTSFWRRRIMRICPAYYVVATIVLSVLVANGELRPAETLYFLGYVQNYFIAATGNWTDFGYSWTMAVEQQFYLVSAVLMLAIPSRLHRPVLGWIAAGLFAALLTIVLLDVMANFTLYLMPFVGFMMAAAGGWASLLDTPPAWWRAVTRGPVMALSAALAAVLAFVPSAWMGAHPVLDVVQICFYVPALTAIVQWVARHQDTWAVEFLEQPLLRFYGAISYSLYLIHGALAHWLKDMWFQYPGNSRLVGFVIERGSLFAVVLAVSTVLAYLSVRFVEKPGIRVGHRMAATA